MQNEGKLFEKDIKDSIPKECYFYRFKDNAASFSGGEGTRFTSSNICDCMTVTDEYLFLLELKSHKGVSVGFNCIRKNQIDEMSRIEHKRIKTYFIFNFREKQKTYAIDAKTLKSYMDSTDRKSIPIQWCKENGIEIIGEKKKVRFRYYLKEFFNEVAKL
jgi:recombination protein U